VIAEKQLLDANRLIRDFPDDGIQVLNGRFGPYITDRERNARVPKDREPASMTLEECRALLAVAPLRGKGRFGRKTAKTKTAAAGTDGAAAKAKGAARKTAGDAPAKKTAAKTAKKKAARKKAPAKKAAKAKVS
jgi:DNA topoisomerase-1